MKRFFHGLEGTTYEGEVYRKPRMRFGKKKSKERKQAWGRRRTPQQKEEEERYRAGGMVPNKDWNGLKKAEKKGRSLEGRRKKKVARGRKTRLLPQTTPRKARENWGLAYTRNSTEKAKRGMELEKKKEKLGRWTGLFIL